MSKNPAMPARAEAPSAITGSQILRNLRAFMTGRPARVCGRYGRPVRAGATLIGLAGILVLAPAAVSDTRPPTTASAPPVSRVVQRIALKPPRGARRSNRGEAVIVARRGRLQLAIDAQLTPNRRGQSYEVWLYDSRRRALSIGAQVTDPTGHFVGAGPLPAGYRKYAYVDISRERLDTNPGHSGVSVLRGRL